MGGKAWCEGTKALLNWFDDTSEETKNGFWSLWDGKILRGSWADGDKEAGRSRLERDVSLAEENGVTDVLTIKLHGNLDKSGNITSATQYTASITFRPCPLQGAGITGVYQPHQVRPNTLEYRLLTNFEEKFNALESKINGIVAEHELEDEEPEPVHPVIGLLNNPQVLDAVGGWIATFLANLTPKVAASAIPPGGNQTQISGVQTDSPDQDINQALAILSKHDNDLSQDLLRLARVAESDPANFNAFLSYLRGSQA